MEEVWKEIEGSNGDYKISTLGNIDTVRTGRRIKPFLSGTGYIYINLYLCGKWVVRSMHRLMAIHFIPNPFNKPCVNHKNSMQGGNEFHYCSPRELCNDYHALELGYPSAEDSLLIEFAENPEDLINTVYPWTPIEVVEQLIEKHGGIVATVNYDIIRNYKQL